MPPAAARVVSHGLLSARQGGGVVVGDTEHRQQPRQCGRQFVTWYYEIDEAVIKHSLGDLEAFRQLVDAHELFDHRLSGETDTGSGFGDGDVAGVMATAMPETGIDLYMGTGGAPEGVLAAAALRCIGGNIQGRLLFRNDDERGRAAKVGVEDLNRKYEITDLASGDVIFAATGVTDGNMLQGVRRTAKYLSTESVAMRARTGTVRWIRMQHPIK